MRAPKEGIRSALGVVGCVLGWGRAGAGAEQEHIDFGVELVEPFDLALELPHLLLVHDLPLLVVFPQLRVLALELPHPLLVNDLPLLELDLSQLVVDNGSPVEHRQQAAEPGQRGVILRFAD